MSEDLKIVAVAPITKNVFNEDLTYFTTKNINQGALVEISVRNKEVPGIVTSVSEAKELKSELKTSEFGFKKIKKVIANRVYLSEFLEAAKETAEYFASSSGQIIRSLTPKSVLVNWQKLSIDTSKQDWVPKSKEPQNQRFEISVLGLPDEERYSFYKSLIREEFAKKHSVFFILPTIHDAEECAETLKRGIEEYTILLHSRLTAKAVAERWQKAIDEKHSVLMITTPIFMSLPREDLATIIVDKENSPFYKTVSRPFIDIRTFAETLAKKKHARLMLGDSIPRIEDIYNAEAGNFIQESPLRYRFPKDMYQEVIDMRKAPQEHAILSPKVKQALVDSIERKQHALIICARKGLGTSTVCHDCGEMITCVNCSSTGHTGLPVVIFKIKNENVFFCNKCGKKSSTDVVCANCSGWKLKILGIATEGVEAEIKSFIPKAKIFRMDGNAIKNYKQAKVILEEFKQTPGSILVGTEMVLGYLNQDVETTAIISIDTLFSIPDFRVNENIFNLLSKLRLKTLKRFLIQTRKPYEKIFNHVLSGDLLEFYREEIRERKRFNYPPFKVLIKITAEGPTNVTNEEMAQLEKFLQNYNPSRFDAFIERINNKERVNILLKIDPKKWPPKDQVEVSDESPYSSLLEILKSLPKRFVVKVDPDNIL